MAIIKKYEIKKSYVEIIGSLRASMDKLEKIYKLFEDSLISLFSASHIEDKHVDNLPNEAAEVINEIINLDEIDNHIKYITDTTDFKYVRKYNNAHHVIDDLAIELTRHMNQIKNNNNSKIHSVLIDIVNQLTFSVNVQHNKETLLNTLKTSLQRDESPDEVIDKLVLFINENTGLIQLENHDLRAFINKINDQLVEIKSFMQKTHADREEAVKRSSRLLKSVDLSVNSIQQKVSSADDINELKKDIAIHLNNIRKGVEENKIAEEQKEEISVQSIAHIINELNSTQKESSNLKEQLQESKKRLLHDPLTGLYNRAAFEDRVIVEINRGKRNKTPLSLAIWDIDYFKKVNDSYGHDVGDRVLKLFSKLIQSRIRKIDMFARIGGEEFALLMPDTSIDMALSLNNSLREVLTKSNFHYNGKHHLITASVGIADFHDGDTTKCVMKRADQALYLSKNSGRNCCNTSVD
jgi:diguanylate cyclase